MDKICRLGWVLSSLVLALCAPSARADWPASPLVNVPVCTVAGAQNVYSLVGDGSGGMIVIWQDTRGGGYDIYAQRLNAAGVLQWNGSGVAICVASGDQLYPQAIADGAGGAIITWQDFRGGGTDIYTQRLDATGAVLWTPGGVALCSAPGGQYFPKVISDGAGGAVVVWADQRVSGHSNFFAQRVGADGTPQWTANGIALTASVVELQQPAVATDGSGGVIGAWHAPSGNPSNLHASAQRVDGSGLARWGADGIPLASVSMQLDPKVTSDGSRGAIIAWADYRDGDGSTATTYAQRVNPAGVPQWTDNGVALAMPSGDQQYQALVPDGAGGAVVVWSDYSSTAIRAQRVDAAGVPQWSLAGVSVCSATGQRQVNRIHADGAGGVLVPWSDYRVGGGDIYVQRVNSAGVPLWTVDGLATCTAPYVQADPNLIADGSGGALVGWSDYRGGDHWHAYAQYVSAAGTLGGSAPVGVGGPTSPATFAVRCAGPNPHSGVLAVDCSLPTGGTAIVGLFDISGRCLETRTLSGFKAGTQRVALEARPVLSPGVYFVRLTKGVLIATTRVVLVP